MHVTANCIAAEAQCAFDTVANLRTPEGAIGFPGDLYARQNMTLRTMDRNMYINFDYVAHEHPDFQVADRQRDLDGLLRWRTAGQVHPSRLAWPIDAHTGQPKTDVPLIVCSYIQVVYAGVNLTSPNACAQAAFS